MKPPIGAAEHAGARRVDVGPRRDRVEQRHQVVGVDRAEPADVAMARRTEPRGFASTTA